MPTIRDQPVTPEPTRTVLVLTTWPGDRDPRAVADGLIADRLAACVNVLAPMESVYQWQGAIQHDAERQLLIKTTVERVDLLHERLCALHPYDVPEFLVIDVRAGAEPYLDWVVASTQE
jgi:periplasmic divalent cation tolerance protein